MKVKGKTLLFRWIFMNSTKTAFGSVFNLLLFVFTYRKWGFTTLKYVEVSEPIGSIWCSEDSDIPNFLALVCLDKLKCESAEVDI